MRISVIALICLVASAVWKHEACNSNNQVGPDKDSGLAISTETDATHTVPAATVVVPGSHDHLEGGHIHSQTSQHTSKPDDVNLEPEELTANDFQSDKVNSEKSTPAILVGGGSYSPVTIMHLRMFERARDHLEGRSLLEDLQGMKKYHVVRGVLSPVADSYGKSGLASGKHRVAMAALAVHGNDLIKVDPWEANKGKHYTPTADLLKHYKDMVDQHVKVMYLCGSDLVETFEDTVDKEVNGNIIKVRKWPEEDIKAILEYGIVVLWRPKSAEPEEHNVIVVWEWAEVGISSSAVREALGHGASIRYFVEDPVIEYIQKHKLWAAEEKASSRHLNIEEAYGQTGESSAHEDGWNTHPGVLPGVGDY